MMIRAAEKLQSGWLSMAWFARMGVIRISR